ncbi:hypothetical protein D3C74_398160 [compost metagenome]
MKRSHVVLISGLRKPLSAKIDWEFWSSDVNRYPPGSATKPVSAPSWNVRSP